MFFFLLLIIGFSSVITAQQKPQQNFLEQSVITDKGYQYGLDIIDLLIEHRKEHNIYKQIKHSSSLQSIVESQVKTQVENPEKFAQHEGFESRADLYSYYSEFITKIIMSKDPAKDALTMWKQNDDTKFDLLSEFDEGAGYCNIFGDGWICELILVKTK